MLSTYTATETLPDCGDYTLACCRGGWIVYKGNERRWPAAAGFATSAKAEDWITHARAGDALRCAPFYDIRQLDDSCYPVVSGTPALDNATPEQMATLFNRWKRDDNGMAWADFARSAIPFDFGAIGVQWCGMFVGIETDGYGHT